MFRPVKDRIEYGGCMIDSRERNAIIKVIDNQGGKRWTIGENSVAFEKELAEKVGVKYAVVVNSGSSALLVAIHALKLPKKAKVIIPALNFPTAYSSILQAGYMPVVVDCDDSLNLSLEEVEKAIKMHPDVKAVVAVHIAGNCVDLVKLRKIVKHRLIVSDNCIAEGTMIKTINGEVPIENVEVGDMVLTRKGYKRVLQTWNKGRQEVISRFGVTATPDHKFITKRGSKELKSLNPSDILYLWNERSLSIEEKSISAIQTQNKDIEESISGTVQSLITGKYGLTKMVRYLKDISYTIKTIIPSIMNYPILKLSLLNNIQEYTLQKRVDLTLQPAILNSLEKGQLNGTSQKKVRDFTLNTTNGFGLFGTKSARFALSVKNLLKRISKELNSAQENVKTVYDLSVEGSHEFFANGVLVHNCDGMGGTLNGIYIDSLADVSCVSFHAAHIISTGEGGAVLTSDEGIATTARKMREWGRASGSDKLTKHTGFPPDYRERYVFEEVGWNLKPLELQCAMGRVQLKKLDKFKRMRLKNYKKLLKGLKGTILTPIVGSDENCWFSFPLLTKDRPRVMEIFEKNNIETRTIFSGNILRHPAYINKPHIRIGDLRNSNQVMRQGMFLSVHPSLAPEMVDYIIEVAKSL